MIKNSIISNKFSSEITSYDLLKTVAVILMIIDHFGYYIFPDVMWLRSLGRICVPIWFFLIGYARTREIPKLWLIYASILVLVNPIVGVPILALNVLCSMVIIRYSIDIFLKYVQKKRNNVWEVALLMFVLVIPSDLLFEYGTQGFLFAMWGYFVRNKEQGDNSNTAFNFMLISFVTYLLYQQLFFAFPLPELILMTAGTLFVAFYLQSFSVKTYPELVKKLPSFGVHFLQISGRYTLEIYVIHVIIFKFIALYLGMENYGLFEFELYH